MRNRSLHSSYRNRRAHSLAVSLAHSPLARSLALFLGRLRCRRFRRQVMGSPRLSSISHEIRDRFSVGFGIHEAKDATVLDAVAEFLRPPCPPTPALPSPPSPGMLVLKPQTQFSLALPRRSRLFAPKFREANIGIARFAHHPDARCLTAVVALGEFCPPPPPAPRLQHTNVWLVLLRGARGSLATLNRRRLRRAPPQHR